MDFPPTMTIKNKLTENEISDVKGLNILCSIERVPNFDSSFYIDPELPCFYMNYVDDTLIAYLFIVYSDDKVIEILAVTHPLYRNKGYFTSLQNKAFKVIPSRLPIHYQIPSNLADPKRLEKKGLVFHHSEEEMINKVFTKGSSCLTPLLLDVIPEVANILAVSFNRSLKDELKVLKNLMIDQTVKPLVLKDKNRVVGFIVVSKNPYTKTSYLFAFCVDVNLRSKGYGKRILNSLLYNPDGYVLRVNRNNFRAIKLYKSAGFSHLSSTDYYKT